MADVVNFSPSSPRNHSCISYSHRRSSSMPVFSSLRFNSSMESDGIGNKIVLQLEEKEPRKGYIQPVQGRNLQNKLRFSKSPQKWWEKRYEPNMKEITSAQDLVDSLRNAGDNLVILDFFSPSCGGCRSLHPKIKKFKDALAKHTTERCSLGPAEGLEESELLALSANRDLSFNYIPKQKPISVSAEEQLRERPNLGDTELLLPSTEDKHLAEQATEASI
ncbi:thioredoxin-like 1-2, chloroplastic isoform X2 [Papaver somniferum]|uniref:thioredoxin-like 1-2, chloroplastic isoform X2 n=1 Tax=Papaver somniferum TaxID=3469 RepID=UPI000E6F8468|nr:thioredoxin-like 1-2, chloroplastic isoform X2 [Papaver somniferum]